MSLFESILVALRSISQNKVRSFLTTLGVIIGVMSVILLISLGEAARDCWRERAGFQISAASDPARLSVRGYVLIDRKDNPRAGRVVRTLCSARDAAPGVNTLSWDLTSSQGTRVPSGRYMIRISAASEDGQQVTAVTSANVSR